MGELTEAAIKKLKVAELKAELTKRDLSAKGKKDELVKRLVDAVVGGGEDGAEDGGDSNSLNDSQESAIDTSQDTSVLDSQESKEESQDGEEAKKEDEPAVEAKPEAEEEEKEKSPPKGRRKSRGKKKEESPVKEDKAKEEPEKDEGAETKKEGSGDAAAEDWVMVDAPNEEEVKAAEEAAKAATEEGKEENDKESKSPEKKSPEKKAVESKSPKEKSPKPGEKRSREEKEEEIKEEQNRDEPFVEVEAEDGDSEREITIGEGQMGLDSYTCDLNFIVNEDGCGGHNLVKNGFAYMWAGAKANKGAKGGKICYEVKLIEKQEVDLPDTETIKHAVRIGWSGESSGLQLGEASLSYGYESSGKVCASSSFFDYGEAFEEGDVIGTYLDLESDPKTLKYTKNGKDLGLAMSLSVKLDEKVLFPHVFIHNMKVELNFGGRDEPWFEPLEGYSLMQNAEEDKLSAVKLEAPKEKEDCEVILMVGLPYCGKTSWANRHIKDNADKSFNIISLKKIMERCKVEGKERKKEDEGYQGLMEAVLKIMSKLFEICPKYKRNFIYDQCNVYKNAQKRKLAPFEGRKRHGVVVIPTHINLRARAHEAKKRVSDEELVPFGDMQDMKCGFHCPEEGEEIFTKLSFPELDARNALKTASDYHGDGQRARKLGREDIPKKGRYDDGRDRNDRYGGSRDNRRDSGGWRNSGSGYGGGSNYRSNNRGGYGSGGGGGGYRGGYRGSYGGGGAYQDPYRRNSGGSSGGGGGYRQNSYSGGSGGGYNKGGYGSYGSSGGYSSGSYGSGSYGSYNSSSGSYGQGSYGSNYNSSYGTNTSGFGNNARGTGQWSQGYSQGSYSQPQQSSQGSWGTGGGSWQGGYNYNSSQGSGSYGGYRY